MVSRPGLTAACLLGAAIAPAFASHTTPSHATQIQAALVRAFPDCVSPSAMSAFLGGTPACDGVVEPLPCGFGSSGKGYLKGKRYPTNAISPADITVHAKLEGLSPECEGRSLELIVEASATVDDCTVGGQRESCTVLLTPFRIGTCIVKKGKCTLVTSVNTATNVGGNGPGGVIVAGRRTSVAIRHAFFRDGGTATEPATLLPLFEAGLQFP